MLFASRSKINSTRFRRSLASASPTVTPPPSAFPCAVSSPCVTVDRARRIVAAPRGAWTCDLSIRRCRLHSRNLRSATQRDRTPACLERSWRGPLGSSGAPPRPPTVPTAPLRGVHTYVKKVRWIGKRTNPLFVCLGLAAPIAKGFTRAAIRAMTPYHDGSVIRTVVNWERRRSSRCSILNRRSRFLGASLRDDFIRIPG